MQSVVFGRKPKNGDVVPYELVHDGVCDRILDRVTKNLAQYLETGVGA